MHDPEGLGEGMSEGKMRGEQKAARRELAGGRGGIQEEARALRGGAMAIAAGVEGLWRSPRRG